MNKMSHKVDKVISRLCVVPHWAATARKLGFRITSSNVLGLGKRGSGWGGSTSSTTGMSAPNNIKSDSLLLDIIPFLTQCCSFVVFVHYHNNVSFPFNSPFLCLSFLHADPCVL